MKNSQRKAFVRIERSNSSKKASLSPQYSNPNSFRGSKSPKVLANGANYRTQLLSLSNRLKQAEIKGEYAITEADDGMDSREKSRKISNEKKFKSIEMKHKQKISKEIEQQLRSSRMKSIGFRVISESQFSRKSANLQPERQTTVSTKKADRKRVLNLVSHPQRYIRFSSNEELEKTIVDQKADIQIMKLEKQLEEYRIKYQKALRAIQAMNKVMQIQNNKHVLQKQIYQQKIRILKAQLESKNASKRTGSIGHIFSHKEFNEKTVIPQSLIIQQPEESLESKMSPDIEIETNSKLEKLIEDYAFLPETSSINKSNLSIESK